MVRVAKNQMRPFWFASDMDDEDMMIQINPSPKARAAYDAMLQRLMKHDVARAKGKVHKMDGNNVKKYVCMAQIGTILSGVRGYAVDLEEAESARLQVSKEDRDRGYVLLDISSGVDMEKHRKLFIANFLLPDASLRDLVDSVSTEYYTLPEFREANGLPTVEKLDGDYPDTVEAGPEEMAGN